MGEERTDDDGGEVFMGSGDDAFTPEIADCLGEGTDELNEETVASEADQAALEDSLEPRSIEVADCSDGLFESGPSPAARWGPGWVAVGLFDCSLVGDQALELWNGKSCDLPDRMAGVCGGAEEFES